MININKTKNLEWFIRISFFVVYGWFGLLKVLGASPAEVLVHELAEKILYFIDINVFYFAFGLFEVLIGIIFLIPKFTKVAFYIVVFHLIATMLPLLLLPNVSWNSFGKLTLIGQYIVKNLFIASSVWALIDITKRK